MVLYLKIIQIKSECNFRIFQNQIFENVSVAVGGQSFPCVVEVSVIAVKPEVKNN
jgi:hypothetical protein